MSAIQTQINERIKSKKVVMYSKPSCPFCRMAKGVLDQYKLSSEDYEIIEIDRDPNCSEIQDALNKITGGRTVPRVFINGTFIGGGSETKALHDSGKLQAMLK